MILNIPLNKKKSSFIQISTGVSCFKYFQNKKNYIYADGNEKKEKEWEKYDIIVTWVLFVYSKLPSEPGDLYPPEGVQGRTEREEQYLVY